MFIYIQLKLSQFYPSILRKYLTLMLIYSIICQVNFTDCQGKSLVHE